MIVRLLKNYKNKEPVDYDKLVKINEFTADFCPTRPIFIDNGASGNTKFFNKVFLLNPDWNWTIMKAHDDNTSFRDILISTLK